MRRLACTGATENCYSSVPISIYRRLLLWDLGPKSSFFQTVLTIVISFLLLHWFFFFQKPAPTFYHKKETWATGSLLICRLFTTTNHNYLNSAIWQQEAGRRITPIGLWCLLGLVILQVSFHSFEILVISKNVFNLNIIKKSNNQTSTALIFFIKLTSLIEFLVLNVSVD